MIATGGFVMMFYTPTWAAPIYTTLTGLGFWIAADDIYQHHRQKTDPEYHSPWHNWWWEALCHAEQKLAGKPKLAWLHKAILVLKSI